MTSYCDDLVTLCVANGQYERIFTLEGLPVDELEIIANRVLEIDPTEHLAYRVNMAIREYREIDFLQELKELEELDELDDLNE